MNIVGGFVHQSLEELVGGIGKRINNFYYHKKVDEIWDNLVQWRKSNFLLGASSPSDDTGTDKNRSP